MPEAPIDEYGNSWAKEYDVRDTSRFRKQWHLQAISQAQCVQGLAKFDFDVGIALAHAHHTATGFRR